MTVKRGKREACVKRLELDEHLPFLMNRAGNLVIQLFSRDLASFDLTVPMWRVLAVLEEQGAQRLTDLAVLTSIEVSTLSRLVASMEARGFLTRDIAPESRREVVIAISPAGSGVLSQVVPIALDYETHLLAGVTPEDLAATKRTLRIAFDRLLERAGRSVPKGRKGDGAA